MVRFGEDLGFLATGSEMKILLEFVRAFASIFLRFGDEKKFSLKSELDVGVFALIFV